MLAAVLIVAVAVTAVLAVRANQRNSHSYTDATVTAVGLSPNRKTIWVQAASYYSSSCSVGHLVIDRHNDKWVIRVRIEHTQDFCTLELCIKSDEQKQASTEHPGTLDVPDGSSSSTPGCQQYGVNLDQPVPENVAVVAS